MQNLALLAQRALKVRKMVFWGNVALVTIHAVVMAINGTFDHMVNAYTFLSLAVVLTLGVTLWMKRLGAMRAVEEGADEDTRKRLQIAGRDLGSGMFFLGILTAFFVGLSAHSFALVEVPSQEVHARIVQCYWGGRGDDTCYGDWEVNGKSYRGKVPYDVSGPVPEHGDIVRISVSIEDPQQVTTEQRTWFARAGYLFPLAVLTGVGIRWRGQSSKVNRVLHEIATSSSFSTTT